jgi:hypothetical protein
LLAASAIARKASSFVIRVEPGKAMLALTHRNVTHNPCAWSHVILDLIGLALGVRPTYRSIRG